MAKKKASSIHGPGLTGNLYVERENISIFDTLLKVQVQVGQGLQHGMWCTESNRKESGKFKSKQP